MRIKIKRYPIIIIGMHRSGTSMVSKLLRKMGLFTGWVLDLNFEAVFFRDRNERVLNAQGGGWDNPTVIDHLLNHIGMKKKVTDCLYKDLVSFPCLSYLGPKYFLKYRSPLNFDIPWGWKDPRNTILLPLWLDIFPDAKIIHIVRNAVDVAQSLADREVKLMVDMINQKGPSLRSFFGAVKRSGDRDRFGWFVLLLRENYNRIHSLGKYGQLGIHSVISLKAGFNLWRIYLERAVLLLEETKNQVLTVRYEDLIEKPEDNLKKLAKFCDLQTINDEKIINCTKLINSGKVFKFKNDSNLEEFYHKIKDNKWMKEFGYRDL